MSTGASIDCDLDGCDKRQTFPPESRPPSSWYLVTHPAPPSRSHAPKVVHGVSTFCSAEHLAAWASKIAGGAPKAAEA